MIVPASAPPSTVHISPVCWLAVTVAVIVADRSVGTVSAAGASVTLNS